MLDIRGPSVRLCDGVTRRGFLRIGSLGVAGLALPSVLAARRAQGASERKRTAVILFWLAGGPSHIDMVDMKPDATAEVRGPFQPIDTNLPGLQVCELMPHHARIANKLTVIRSLHHNLAVHDDGSHWLQTGHPLLNARQRGQQNPSQGSVVAALRGPNRMGVPPYVCIPEDYRRHLGFYESAAFLSSRYNAVNGGGDPSLGNYSLPDFVPPAAVSLSRLDDRRSLVQQIDQLRRANEADPTYQSQADVQKEAFELCTSQAAQEAFDVSREPATLHERYGRHAWGRAALLARRLVEAGVTFININFYEKDVDWWDDHYTIEKNLRKRLPLFDQSFCALIEDLHDRGLANEVLVAAFGEFGRTPRIDSGAGRGHWPGAMHAVLSGGGIRGGQIIGSTTANGGEPHTRPLVPGDLLATMYRSLGIDHQTTVLDRQSRPIPIIDAGKPIAELF